MEELNKYFNPSCDGTPQAAYLKELGSKEVQGGICLHLVIAWLHFYKKANLSKAPNVIWQEMKTPTTIKQIANNHRAYHEAFKENDSKNLPTLIYVRENVAAYTNINVITEDETPFDYAVLGDNIVTHLEYSSMQILGITLRENDATEDTGGHALGIIKHDDGYFYLFDPNIGVLRATEEDLEGLLHAIQLFYQDCGVQITSCKIYNIA